MFSAHFSGRPATSIRLAGLAALLWTTWSTAAAEHHMTPARSLIVLSATALAACAWLVWTFWSSRQTMITPDLYVFAICGAVVQMADSSSAASAFVFVAAVSSSARAGVWWGLSVALAGALATAVCGLIYDVHGVVVLAYSLGFAAVTLGGSNIRQTRLRAEQAELLLAQTQRSQEEHLRSARLEDQARLARDIHDLLAHSLAGLTIQLEATTALLDQGADPASVRERILRAHELAREGLRETRRAVGALRGEEPGVVGQEGDVQVLPRIERLAADYRDGEDQPASLTVTGDSSRLSGQVGETVLRAVQESLTNARKHAAGAPVTITLSAGSSSGDEITLTIEDRQSAAVPTGRAGLSATGGGYGLRGMRERAQQCGGTLSAGPTASGWRVELRIPGERA